jgi:hypothetical protein
MGVIGILSVVIVVMYQRANKIYGYRLTERDTLVTVVSNATNATKDHTKSMEDRSNALRELAHAIKEQSAEFEALQERVKLQYEFLSEELKRHAQVIAAIAEADRALSAIAIDARNASTDTRLIGVETKTIVTDTNALLKSIHSILGRAGSRRQHGKPKT